MISASAASGEDKKSMIAMIKSDRSQALQKVAVLLCTYNGQHYLPEQLNSFAAQTHGNWEVWASDDGSTDETHSILNAYRNEWPEGRLCVCQGPAKGFVANFLSLTCNSYIRADYYAYSDQDDVWEADKLARALRWLETLPPDVPGLYCARTRVVNANNQEIGISPLFDKPPSFANALMQNIGGGNTMVFNNATRALLCEAGVNTSIITHDWWAYLVVTGCGGQVFYDTTPTLRYRQHEDNVIGTSSNWMARLKRVRMLLRGDYQVWNESNIVGLHTIEHRLTPENREILRSFAQARHMSLIPRLLTFKRCGIYRQTFIGNVGLIAAAILGKI